MTQAYVQNSSVAATMAQKNNVPDTNLAEHFAQTKSVKGARLDSLQNIANQSERIQQHKKKQASMDAFAQRKVQQAQPGFASNLPIQRFVIDARLSPGKISDGGHLAVTGKQEAYASDEKIAEANAVLNEGPGSVVLEPGAEFHATDPEYWGEKFGETVLHKITPVYKESTPVAKTEHEPVEDEDAETRQQKLAAYKASLTQGLQDTLALYVEVTNAWHTAQAEKNGFLGFTKDAPGSVIHGRFLGRIVQLINQTMGAAWTANENARPVINPNPPAALTLIQINRLFQSLSDDFTRKVQNDLADERAIQELMMSLPNDCKQAALILTGKDAAALSQVKDNPDVGDNYYKMFGNNYGWRTHYATVVAKDTKGGNTDNLTFEAAADTEAKVEKGKTLGFFEMYGTQIPAQTFEHQILGKQKEYIGRQTAAELEGADDETRVQIEADRDEDYEAIEASKRAIEGR